MYKDKDKQREANRKASQRRRDKGMTQGMTPTGNVAHVIPKVGLSIKDRLKSDQRFTKLLAQAGPGHVRVSKPGDDDYEPMCETTQRFGQGGPGGGGGSKESL